MQWQRQLLTCVGAAGRAREPGAVSDCSGSGSSGSGSCWCCTEQRGRAGAEEMKQLRHAPRKHSHTSRRW